MDDDQAPAPIQYRPWTFFPLAFGLTWLCWGAAYWVARGHGGATGGTQDLLANAPPAMLVLVLLGVFGPFTSAFLLTHKDRGKAGVKALWKSGWRFRLPPTWFLVALLLFPATRIISLLIGGAGVSFELFTNPVGLIGLALFMFFLGGPFGEEFGWRGYALPGLLQKYNATTASLIIGVIWVVWHLPLFIIPGSPQAEIPFWPWATEVVAMAVLYTWLLAHVDGAVFAAILFHTMGNFSTDLFQPVREIPVGWGSPEGLNVIIKVGMALAVILIFGPKRLRRGSPAPS